MTLRHSGLWLGLVLLLVLNSTVAHAQPLFNLNHDWTWEIGGQSYGITEHQEVSSRRFMTTVWFGFEQPVYYSTWPAWQLIGGAGGVLVLMVVLLGVVGTWWGASARRGGVPGG